MAEIDVKKINDDTAILPGHQVLMTCVRLPKLSRAQQASAVAFALEPSLIQNIEDCFFAIGETNEAGETIVGVIDKQYFKNVLKHIEENHWTIKKILPDFLALPYEANTWTVWYHKHGVSVRTGLYSGFSVETANFDTLAAFYGDKKSDRIVELHAETFDTSTPFNLLQGNYRPKQQQQRINRMRRFTIYTLISLFASITAAQILPYYYFTHQTQQVQKRTTQLYKKTFHNMKTQDLTVIQNTLKQISIRPKNQLLWTLLTKLGVALKTNPAIKLLSFTYKKQKLQLNIDTQQPSLLDNFSKTLTELKLKIKIQHIRISANKTTANIEVKKS